MKNVPQDIFARQSVMDSIDREELLLNKYAHYGTLLQDGYTCELLCEFEQTCREHIALLKEKLQHLEA